jgi:flagellar protein FlgJ
MRIDLGTPGLSAPTEAARTAKLTDAAQQFEAMMLQEMLKPLRFGATDSEDDGQQDGPSETMRGFANEAIGKALARTGQFGLARQIIRQVTVEHSQKNEGKLSASVTKV